jgi:hypothetical protein
MKRHLPGRAACCVRGTCRLSTDRVAAPVVTVVSVSQLSQVARRRQLPDSTGGEADPLGQDRALLAGAVNDPPVQAAGRVIVCPKAWATFAPLGAPRLKVEPLADSVEPSKDAE